MIKTIILFLMTATMVILFSGGFSWIPNFIKNSFDKKHEIKKIKIENKRINSSNNKQKTSNTNIGGKSEQNTTYDNRQTIENQTIINISDKENKE